MGTCQKSRVTFGEYLSRWLRKNFGFLKEEKRIVLGFPPMEQKSSDAIQLASKEKLRNSITRGREKI